MTNKIHIPVVVLSLPLALYSFESLADGNSVGISAIYVDGPNGKFGEYNGLDDDHMNGALDVDWWWRSSEQDGRYVRLLLDNVGLDTFSVEGRYGVQGSYELRAGYDQLQKVFHDDAFTLYDNELNTLIDPRKITTEVDRETTSIGFDKIFGGSDWTFSSDYRSQKKDGQRARPVNGGLIVPMTLDYTHEEMDVSLTYADKIAQVKLFSYFSKFENDEELVLASAAEPENTFLQFGLNGGINISPTSRIKGYFSYSHSQQDESFDDYGIIAGTYSTDDLDAELDDIKFQLGYFNRLSRKFSITMDYRYDTRDNDTQLYDDFPSDKNNKVYEWTKHRFDIKVRYRLPGRWRLNGGLGFYDFDYDMRKAPQGSGSPTHQASHLSDDSEETVTWAELRSPVMGGFSGKLKYTYSDRDVSLDDQREEGATTGTTGVALSSYLIEREQDKVNLTLTQMLGQSVSVSLSATYVDDDYDGIVWNSLDSQEQEIYTLDISYSPSRDISLSVYVGIENYEFEQSGFGSLADPSTMWEYRVDDSTELFGATLRADNVIDDLDISLDYRYQAGEGEYKTVDPSNVSGEFPDLETTINSLTLNADYRVNKQLSVNARYIYEDYDSDSWVWRSDFGQVDSGYTDVLDYGYDSPNYTSQVVQVGATYHF
jgi:MtrB/PioB family decaheme-associated outer membrane protein